MAKTNDTRTIYSVETLRMNAETTRDHLDTLGRHPKILARTVSAEGISREIFVVTCDEWVP
jgi:hypothetical protein